MKYIITAQKHTHGQDTAVGKNLGVWEAFSGGISHDLTIDGVLDGSDSMVWDIGREAQQFRV